VNRWLEMFDFLFRHKLRTALTGLSVAWGIFMLVLLLAAGRGLQNGVEHDFRDDAVNSIWIRPAKTSLPFHGQPPGRPVELENADIEAVRKELPLVERLTGRFNLRGEFSVSRGSKSAAFDILGCHPDHLYLEKTILLQGRFINDRDLAEYRKVAVISIEIQRELFAAENPIGQTINIRGVRYVVVGVYRDEGGQAELKKIYLPMSTAQLVYSDPKRVDQIMFTTGSASVEQSKSLTEQARNLLARRHGFDPNDRRALSINNNLERFEKLSQIFRWIRVFVWAVGVGTLFAGMVAVSNIMLISVKERTVEIGIRKALGATPANVVWMVLEEALFITSVAGYSGLVLGALVVEAVQRYMPPNDYLRSPEVDLRSALIATLLLVFAGALAGFVPALTAARVKPVVAMRGA
jgi:putative ABC transport system permease protein